MQQHHERRLGRTRRSGRGLPKALGMLAMTITLPLAAACDPPGSTTSDPTAVVIGSDGLAIAPRSAPEPVKAMIAAANGIAGLPYRFGGGHTRWKDSGYDGSGATSYVLHAAGLLSRPLDAARFRTYGIAVPAQPKPDDDATTPGWWVTIFVCGNGVHMKIRNVEFDAHSDSGFPGEDARLHWRDMHDGHERCVARAPQRSAAMT
jgi:hypothetical protein